MADYYTLIARAVSGLFDNTADARQVLYTRARAALIDTLKSQDPPLKESDIERERSALEESIQRVEQEARAGQTQKAKSPEQASAQPQTTAQASAPSEQAATAPPWMKRVPEAEAGSHPTDPTSEGVRNAFKYLNHVLLALTCAVSILLASVVFVAGPTWFATHILDYLVFAACAAVILCALGMWPTVQARVSKIGLLHMFLVSSYLVGMTTWLLGVLTTLQYWRWTGVVIGLCLGIVGIVPLGVVAAAMSADWSMVAMMIVGVLVAYGARDLALAVVDTDNRSAMSAPG